MDEGIIAYLPSDSSWCKQDFPHMTLVYTGGTDSRPDSDFSAMSKDAVTAARLTGSFSLPVTGVEEFGKDEDAVDVLTFYPSPQLLVARQLVFGWNVSEFTDFKPHATIGPAGSAAEIEYNHNNSLSRYDDEVRRRPDGLPLSVYFNRIAVCWGERKLIFSLNDMY